MGCFKQWTDANGHRHYETVTHDNCELSRPGKRRSLDDGTTYLVDRAEVQAITRAVTRVTLEVLVDAAVARVVQRMRR